MPESLAPIFLDTIGLKRGVVIHHWDTDGIVSAAIVRRYFSHHWPDVKLDLFMPTITNYYLTEDQLNYLQQQGYQFVVTCDLNFPADTVQSLAQRWPEQVYFFDHHHHPAPHSNVHYYNKPHPACASHLAVLLNLPYDLLPVIAMVGDREEAIQQDEIYYPYVRAVMAEYQLTFGQLLEARRLIDSSYMVDDYAGIAETVQLLQDDPIAILSDVRLQDNLHKIEAEIERCAAQPPTAVAPKLMFWEISTPLHILSHVTRHLSRQYPEAVIFTRQQTHQQFTCYIRRRQHSLDVRLMIKFAHSLGLNAGGKEEVAGIIIPAERLNEFFPKIQAELIRLTTGQP